MVSTLAAWLLVQDSYRNVFEPLADRDVRVLVVGLAKSRRPDFLRKIEPGPAGVIDLPGGLRAESLKAGGVTLLSFELKEGAAAGASLEGVHAIVFIVDSSDRDRLSGARAEIAALMKAPRLARAALLVFADQQEIPNSLSAKDVSAALELAALKNRAWYIQGCAVPTGDGLREGLDWLVHTLNKAPRELPPDVVDADPAAPLIERVLKTGLLSTFHGRFQGSLAVNRYEAARSFARLLTIGGVKGPFPDNPVPEFKDVPPDHPARADVQFCAQAGVLQDYAGNFHGDKLINRYQMAVILKNVLRRVGVKHGPAPTSSPIPDLPAKHWSFDSVALTVGEGLMQPFPDGRYYGNKVVDRHQMAGILYRMGDRLGWKNLPAPEPLPPPPADRELPILERELTDRLSEVERLKSRIAELRDGK